MECLACNGLDEDEVNLNNSNISELSFSSFSEKLFLQENNGLTMIPPYIFQHILVLQVLDLSHTSIQSLSPFISRLHLLEKLILKECSLLMEVPPEVGALKNLKLFDLEGTELMYLPKQIGKLETLECLRFSLSACADDQKERYGIQYIIPRMMISRLSKLKELSISVDPEAEWWEVELLEAIMGDLPFLPEIETLKLYLPTAKALQQFLRLERFRVPIHSSLWNFRFMIGHCEQLPFSVQLDIEESFLELEKCVKYMNGEGYTSETAELIRDAKALYLRRHWDAEKLSMFDTRRLKYCLLMECNELQTLVDQGDIYKHKNRSSHSEDKILGLLQYLSIHFMKKLQRISKGRIGRNSLSYLRILALHTCPKLTSIFTGCLLSNMQSLTELIVEDCPKVKCLVDLGEVTPWSNGPFLPSLKRVSLINLPELVSISGGVCIASQLDTLLIFNCMKLNYLSVMEIPRGTKAIKGEIEWWAALKYGKSTWHNVFVQLKRDGGLMDQLAEDTNSLKHFLDLEIIPSHHGEFHTDHRLGCNYISTKEDLEHVDQLHIDSLPSPNEIQKIEDTDCDMKAVNHQLASAEKKRNNGDIDIAIDTWIQLLKIRRTYIEHPRFRLNLAFQNKLVKFRNCSKHQVKMSKGNGVEIAHDDGYLWWKYGQKDIHGSKYPRSYYRCSFKTTDGCFARKHVQRSTEDPSVFEVCYQGVHTCPTKLKNNLYPTETAAACKTLRIRGSPTATDSASNITDNPYDDGYVWRKYGNREILEGENSKYISYYRCTSCNAKKQVKRSDDNPSIKEITYYGMHTCLRLSLASDSTGATESALSNPKSSDCLTTTEPASEISKISAFSTTAESTTITDNSFGLGSTKNASIHPWKQQVKEIESSFSPSTQLLVPSPSINSKPNVITSEIAEDSSRNLPSPVKTAQNAKDSLSSLSKARKEKLGDRISALHQLVSPFGKTDTASVLLEATAQIRFLESQIEALTSPYMNMINNVSGGTRHQHSAVERRYLASRGLCLAPVTCMDHINTTNITSNEAEFWNPAHGGGL